MTDECISPLRRRMIEEDMTVRNFVPKMQSDYIRRHRICRFSAARPIARAGRCPRLPAASGIKRRSAGNGEQHRIGAAVFLRRQKRRSRRYRQASAECRELCKAPIVLSPEEVARMLEAAPGLKYKAAWASLLGRLRVLKSLRSR